MEYDDEMSKTFKGIWIPLSLLSDRRLSKPELMVLTIIKHLDNEDGCYAYNHYFGNILNLSNQRVSRIIRSLIDKEYVYSIINTKKGNQRILRVNN